MTEPLFRIFVYGTLLEGERDHALLAGSSRIGEAYTEATFHLVDLDHYAALVFGGTLSVYGQIYQVSAAVRRDIDVKRQVPILFQRERIQIKDDAEIDAYVMSADQVRGRRRLHHGDWRKRVAPSIPRTLFGGNGGGGYGRWPRNRP
jgi:gamma-glutamylcyclotransferase (GGCT)/AIG2-like uncharacterized protein YtfP